MKDYSRILPTETSIKTKPKLGGKQRAAGSGPEKIVKQTDLI
jgi:hypothetical protein